MTPEQIQELGNDLMREWHQEETKSPLARSHSVSLIAYAKMMKTNKENIRKALELLKETKQIELEGLNDDWTVTFAK